MTPNDENPWADPPPSEMIEELQADIEREQEEWDPLDLPESQEQLVRDIKAAGGPDEMINKVAAGIYHDYVSPHPMPKHQLVKDATENGLEEIAHRAKRGDYDP